MRDLVERKSNDDEIIVHNITDVTSLTFSFVRASSIIQAHQNVTRRETQPESALFHPNGCFFFKGPESSCDYYADAHVFFFLSFYHFINIKRPAFSTRTHTDHLLINTFERKVPGPRPESGAHESSILTLADQ